MNGCLPQMINRVRKMKKMTRQHLKTRKTNKTCLEICKKMLNTCKEELMNNVFKRDLRTIFI